MFFEDLSPGNPSPKTQLTISQEYPSPKYSPRSTRIELVIFNFKWKIEETHTRVRKYLYNQQITLFYFQKVCAKQKRLQDFEAKAERPAKHLQRSHPPYLELFEEDSEAKAKANDPEPPPLSEESEKDIQTLYKAVISSVNKTSTLKWTSSWRSTIPSETNTVRSQRSSNTTAQYCYKHLDDANVYIHINPSEDIQVAIKNIINAKPSKDCIAKNFSKKCKEIVRAAAGEDDFVHLFYIVIKDISRY